MITSVKIFSQDVIKIKSNSNASDFIFEKADILPEYPGGINVFRQKFSQTFDMGRVKSEGITKSEAQFVIDEEGNLTKIIAVGENTSMNEEMERVVKRISKTKWKPAEISGKPVKYRIKLPITMNL